MKHSESKTGGIMVCGEVRRGNIHSVTAELVGKARELADVKGVDVKCLLLCGMLEDPPELPIRCGADEVILIQDARLELFNQEITAKITSHMIGEVAPEIVLAPATTAGRSYLPAVAAQLRTGLTADCTGLEIEEESGLLLQTRPAIGGNIMATIKTPNRVPQMSTVRPRTFRAPEERARRGRVIRPEVPEELYESGIEVLGFETGGGERTDIQDKDVVVAGGKGLRRPENFSLIRRLAAVLDGGVGASRPTVEAKWIPYPHQVGLSGKVVSPKLYIAAGISGAVQHLAGMQTSGKIVAINKDPEAPIFEIADIALCGDLNEILPKLTERLLKEKKI
jgi:electron transfer flavoprotein alpha subunit